MTKIEVQCFAVGKCPKCGVDNKTSLSREQLNVLLRYYPKGMQADVLCVSCGHEYKAEVGFSV